MYFDSLIPTKILFGRGRINEIGPQCSIFGRKVLLVTGKKFFKTSQVINKIEESLRTHGVTPIYSSPITPNAHSDDIDSSVAIARKENVKAIVGIGGGSVLDASKAIAVGIFHPFSVGSLVGKTLEDDTRALPIIAIPTTAGTGSEVSKAAIVVDIKRKLKSGIRGVPLFPRIAIVDPELIRSLPIKIVRETVFDALTHSIESYISRNSNPINDVLAEKAFKLLGKHLPNMRLEGPSAEQIDDLSLAALLGGINIANCGTCLPHRLQQALGTIEGMIASHGEGLAALYPSWLEKVYPFAKEKFDNIAMLLGGSSIQDTVNGMLVSLNLKIGLNDLGVNEKCIPTIVKNISGNIKNDPISNPDYHLFESILKNSL